MNYEFSLKISSNEEPSFTITKDYPLSNHFSINFQYNQLNFPLHTNASNSSSLCKTTMNQILLIPCDILCNCNEITILDKEANIFLYFSSVPISPNILNQILPKIGEYAESMVTNNNEGHNMWEIDVTLDVMTYYIEDHDAVEALIVVDSLKKVGKDHYSCYFTDQCAICLEEFFNGSKSEHVMTKCLHVFHKECIFQWLKRCISHQSSFSCPLCRNDRIL